MNNNISDFVRMSSNHYKPDILIALYDNITKKFLRAMIIEVKCCSSRRLQSKNGPSSAIEQVKSYYNFGYYDKKQEKGNKTKRDAIKKAIIVYPKQDTIAKYEYDDVSIPFIQIEAKDTSDVTQHYGFYELKKEIDNCLFEKK